MMAHAAFSFGIGNNLARSVLIIRVSRASGSICIWMKGPQTTEGEFNGVMGPRTFLLSHNGLAKRPQKGHNFPPPGSFREVSSSWKGISTGVDPCLSTVDDRWFHWSGSGIDHLIHYKEIYGFAFWPCWAHSSLFPQAPVTPKTISTGCCFNTFIGILVSWILEYYLSRMGASLGVTYEEQSDSGCSCFVMWHWMPGRRKLWDQGDVTHGGSNENGDGELTWRAFWLCIFGCVMSTLDML